MPSVSVHDYEYPENQVSVHMRIDKQCYWTRSREWQLFNVINLPGEMVAISKLFEWLVSWSISWLWNPSKVYVFRAKHIRRGAWWNCQLYVILGVRVGWGAILRHDKHNALLGPQSHILKNMLPGSLGSSQDNPTKPETWQSNLKGCVIYASFQFSVPIHCPLRPCCHSEWIRGILLFIWVLARELNHVEQSHVDDHIDHTCEPSAGKADNKVSKLILRVAQLWQLHISCGRFKKLELWPWWRVIDVRFTQMDLIISVFW